MKKGGVYWFWIRAQRSDAACDELVLLMRQYWQTDEVSRATGNSPDRDMWKAAKSPTAERHPRRQLIEAGATRCTRSFSSGRTTGASSCGRGPTLLTTITRSSSRRGASAWFSLSRTGDEAGEPVWGEEVVDVRKVKRTYRLITRLASCFFSACQRSHYEDCHVNRAYPGIVPALRDGQVRETVIIDTGVAPVDGSEAEEITFKSQQKTRQM